MIEHGENSEPKSRVELEDYFEAIKETDERPQNPCLAWETIVSDVTQTAKTCCLPRFQVDFDQKVWEAERCAFHLPINGGGNLEGSFVLSEEQQLAVEALIVSERIKVLEGLICTKLDYHLLPLPVTGAFEGSPASLIDAETYLFGARTGKLSDPDACNDHQVHSNGNGTYSNRRCRLPKLRVVRGSEIWVSDFCSLHTNLDEYAEAGTAATPPNFSAVLGDVLISEQRKVDSVLSKSDISRFGDAYGGPSDPISNVDANRLDIHNEVRRHLRYKNARVDGPVFIKNCKIERLDLEMEVGAKLTIADSEIGHLKWTSNEDAELKVWLGNSSVDSLSCSQASISDFGAKDTRVGIVSLAPNQTVTGKIVLTNSECHFEGGDFSKASVAVAKRLSFSNSKVKGCRVSPWTTDEWQTLLRSYGGTNSLFAVLLLLVFAVPLMTDYAVWSAVHKAQGLLEALPMETMTRANISRCLADDCEQMNLLLLIFGYQNGLPYLLLTASLLLLNVLRLLMTREVAAIRENSEISGRYPERGNILPPWNFKNAPGGSKLAAWRYSYRHLTILHHVISALIVVSLGSFIYSSISLIGQTVWVPAN
ncbi:hypothetical protein [Pseudaestuariivita atlantica]|uniref:hypothetical protein n=1 Tax=Pseudaestuariivita atlantica TaxID=1317121 RepID=UPI00106B8798|nr:hypothetical protein [Pseudaestuariivita atlantica]